MKKNKREPMPKHFKSPEDAGGFWDTHDIADYWEKTKESALLFNLRKRRCYISILPGIEKNLNGFQKSRGLQ